jgi:uncharacterized protein YbjT (DUF2867 family)
VAKHHDVLRTRFMILVTGATCSNGSELLKRLAPAGVPVRAMVRSTSKMNELLRGVEIAVADFDEDESLTRAF